MSLNPPISSPPLRTLQGFSHPDLKRLWGTGSKSPLGERPHSPWCPPRERSPSPSCLRCAAEKAAWARAKSPTPTSPFHNDGAMIQKERQPNKRRRRAAELSLVSPPGVHAAQEHDVIRALGAKCGRWPDSESRHENAEKGMPGRRGQRRGKRT